VRTNSNFVVAIRTLIANIDCSVSGELNSTETHFVSELLQNADDNKYPPGATPEAVISLFNDRSEFQFECNEAGFEETNVEALCRSG
jgi:hypothetical protein